MARWIPTKRQKYGVGECSPHPARARLPRSSRERPWLAQSWALDAGPLGTRAARYRVRLPLPSQAQSGLSYPGDSSRLGTSLPVWGIRGLKVHSGSGTGHPAPEPKAQALCTMETSKDERSPAIHLGHRARVLAFLLRIFVVSLSSL